MQATNATSTTNAAVAVFTGHDQAEAAVKALQAGGFDMRRLSIIGQDYHSEEHVVGYYTAGERMWAWGQNGAFWGGIWGLLFGAAFFWVPVIGPIAVGGPLVAAIIAALEGAALVGGLSAVGAGLVGLGIPDDSIVEYESEVKAGKFLVVANGSSDEVEHAKNILTRAGLDAPHLHVAVAA